MGDAEGALGVPGKLRNVGPGSTAPKDLKN